MSTILYKVVSNTLIAQQKSITVKIISFIENYLPFDARIKRSRMAIASPSPLG